MQQQRLLKNMGAHTVVLDLLQIPYEKVGHCPDSQFLCFRVFIFPEGLFFSWFVPRVMRR